MNKEDLYRAIGDLDEKHLEKTSRKRAVWISAAAAVLAAVLCVSWWIPALTGHSNPDAGPEFMLDPASAARLEACALVQARYPQMAHYPEEEYPTTDAQMEAYDLKYEAWRKSVEAQKREAGYADGLEPFFADTMSTFLTEENGKNKVCSPLNIYMALGMLAEISGGDTRQEILDVLGQEKLEALRRQADDVWNAQYRNDHATAMVLANSLWLNKGYPYRQEPLDILANDYHASSFSGVPGTEDYNQALQAWLNYQTGGLLQEQAGNVELDPQTVIALASTLWYQAKWETEFLTENTRPEVFTSAQESETVDFMHSSRDDWYYWAQNFGAVGIPMENSGGTMWLLLPDDGITPEQLLTQEETFEFLQQGRDWKQQKRLIVNMAIPKFDISADLSLKDGLKKMGIDKAFAEGQADFTPLLEQADGVAVSPYVQDCSHAVRVTVDEEGVSAAAFVELATAGACKPPDEEVDFVLNRPFVFVMQSPDGLPLFSGVVNQP